MQLAGVGGECALEPGYEGRVVGAAPVEFGDGRGDGPLAALDREGVLHLREVGLAVVDLGLLAGRPVGRRDRDLVGLGVILAGVPGGLDGHVRLGDVEPTVDAGGVVVGVVAPVGVDRVLADVVCDVVQAEAHAQRVTGDVVALDLVGRALPELEVRHHLVARDARRVHVRRIMRGDGDPRAVDGELGGGGGAGPVVGLGHRRRDGVATGILGNGRRRVLAHGRKGAVLEEDRRALIRVRHRVDAEVGRRARGAYRVVALPVGPTLDRDARRVRGLRDRPGVRGCFLGRLVRVVLGGLAREARDARRVVARIRGALALVAQGLHVIGRDGLHHCRRDGLGRAVVGVGAARPSEGGKRAGDVERARRKGRGVVGRVDAGGDDRVGAGVIADSVGAREGRVESERRSRLAADQALVARGERGRGLAVGGLLAVGADRERGAGDLHRLGAGEVRAVGGVHVVVHDVRTGVGEGDGRVERIGRARGVVRLVQRGRGVVRRRLVGPRRPVVNGRGDRDAVAARVVGARPALGDGAEVAVRDAVGALGDGRLVVGVAVPRGRDVIGAHAVAGLCRDLRVGEVERDAEAVALDGLGRERVGAGFGEACLREEHVVREALDVLARLVLRGDGHAAALDREGDCDGHRARPVGGLVDHRAHVVGAGVHGHVGGGGKVGAVGVLEAHGVLAEGRGRDGSRVRGAVVGPPGDCGARDGVGRLGDRPGVAHARLVRVKRVVGGLGAREARDARHIGADVGLLVLGEARRTDVLGKVGVQDLGPDRVLGAVVDEGVGLPREDRLQLVDRERSGDVGDGVVGVGQAAREDPEAARGDVLPLCVVVGEGERARERPLVLAGREAGVGDAVVGGRLAVGDVLGVRRNGEGARVDGDLGRAGHGNHGVVGRVHEPVDGALARVGPRELGRVGRVAGRVDRRIEGRVGVVDGRLAGGQVAAECDLDRVGRGVVGQHLVGRGDRDLGREHMVGAVDEGNRVVVECLGVGDHRAHDVGAGRRGRLDAAGEALDHEGHAERVVVLEALLAVGEGRRRRAVVGRLVVGRYRKVVTADLEGRRARQVGVAAGARDGGAQLVGACARGRLAPGDPRLGHGIARAVGDAAVLEGDVAAEARRGRRRARLSGVGPGVDRGRAGPRVVDHGDGPHALVVGGRRQLVVCRVGARERRDRGGVGARLGGRGGARVGADGDVVGIARLDRGGRHRMLGRIVVEGGGGPGQRHGPARDRKRAGDIGDVVVGRRLTRRGDLEGAGADVVEACIGGGRDGREADALGRLAVHEARHRGGERRELFSVRDGLVVRVHGERRAVDLDREAPLARGGLVVVGRDVVEDVVLAGLGEGRRRRGAVVAGVGLGGRAVGDRGLAVGHGGRDRDPVREAVVGALPAGRGDRGRRLVDGVGARDERDVVVGGVGGGDGGHDVVGARGRGGAQGS